MKPHKYARAPPRIKSSLTTSSAGYFFLLRAFPFLSSPAASGVASSTGASGSPASLAASGAPPEATPASSKTPSDHSPAILLLFAFFPFGSVAPSKATVTCWPSTKARSVTIWTRLLSLYSTSTTKLPFFRSSLTDATLPVIVRSSSASSLSFSSASRRASSAHFWRFSSSTFSFSARRAAFSAFWASFSAAIRSRSSLSSRSSSSAAACSLASRSFSACTSSWCLARQINHCTAATGQW
mmetsp:Transcript_41057/g.113089  ORF Transcript_41057/g.113089 Transcript_41057/m.113089 type:complete len:240 (-) Transcript_41057:721-1440(-)